MMTYQVKKAVLPELSRIEEIYAYARQFMADHGNPNQWGKATPPHEQLVRDIEERKLHAVCDESGIHGVFYFSIEEDPSYAVIEDGAWRSTSPYGVIHRIAGDGSGGILRAAVAYAEKQINHLRIDTHRDNYVMQQALAKQGFEKRGIIHIADGSPRIAYDKLT